MFWVEVIGQNGCASTSEVLDFTLLDCSCDFEPIIEVDDDCCVTLSFDNNSTGCFSTLDVHTHGEPAMFSPSGDFALIGSGPADIQLEYSPRWRGADWHHQRTPLKSVSSIPLQ